MVGQMKRTESAGGFVSAMMARLFMNVKRKDQGIYGAAMNIGVRVLCCLFLSVQSSGPVLPMSSRR